MAESIAILGITLGIIGFLNAARGSAQVIHDDVKNWKKARLAIDKLLLDLDDHIKLFDDWKEDWMIWEHDDHHFYDFLWGERRTTIQDKLGQISVRSEELSISLERLKTNSSKTLEKFKFVFVKKKYLEECMTIFGDIVGKLHETARGYYRTEHGYRGEPTREQIRLIGKSYQMVRLCMKTSNISQEFHEACKRVLYGWVVDLELDFFKEEAAEKEVAEKEVEVKRLKTISRFAATSNLRYMVFAKNPQSEIVIKTAVSKDTTLQRRECERTLTGALQKVLDERETPSAFDTPREDGPRFRVKESSGGSNMQSLCYRKHILCQVGTDFVAQSEDPHLIRRMKLALNLVEAGLLLLKTTWFSGLCSCSFLCREGGKLTEGAPMLRTGHVDHIKPQWMSMQPLHCWCEPNGDSPTPIGEMNNEHVRLLGILLTELALGWQVLDIRKSPRLDLEVELVGLDETSAPTRRWEPLQATINRVRRATSHKFAGAVGYCLKSTKTPDQIRQPDAEQYYWKVLVPAQEYYETLTMAPKLPHLSDNSS